ncbi:hypothetical protein IX39_12695 [Chryseobacterium formosense]|uniref:Uncharacterized protein n=1 Tax=Chryseobacterium formosense TaxID=236814 RepID=A0A085ZAF3_9FLAO|nr:hypothetical protein [Chryseobacterium formosense]KFF01417.1 hypothetical protein IX39_12695 [Chryseobacterium formosense]SFT47040.1 hypothetical protein SAMN05421857_1222 [Chryseobacterium formosense]
MRKFILGAFATFMISASVLANETNANSVNVENPTSAEKAVSSSDNSKKTNFEASLKFDALMMRRICVIRVITTYPNGSTSTQVYTYPVDGGEDPTLAQTQCQALKALHIAALD